MESDRRVGVHAADAAHLRAKLELARQDSKREKEALREKELVAHSSELDLLKSRLSDAELRISELQEENNREVCMRDPLSI